MQPFIAAALALLAVVVSTVARASCGAAFCLVNSAWDLPGGADDPGARLDLRYETIRQGRPLAGGRRVSVGELRRHHDEVSTANRNLVGALDFSVADRWGFNVAVPVVDRSHRHIHNHGGGQIPEGWDFRAVGDTRLLGRYRLSDNAPSASGDLTAFGLNAGLKLPTGRQDERNREGALAERSLQPGTGTTDLLVGGYATRFLPLADLSWFAQGLAQLPVNARSGYRPGARLSLDSGIRYEVDGR